MRNKTNSCNTSRRSLLKSLLGIATTSSITSLAPPIFAQLKPGENNILSRSQSSDLANLTATEAVYLMRSGELSAVEYASALIEVFDRYDRLNVFINRDDDQLLGAAIKADHRRNRGDRLGVLHGLPVLIKDNIETEDFPTSAGTRSLKGRHTHRNAAVVQALFDAGALLAGKANMHELAAGGEKGCIAGQVLNPYNQEMRSGGSSSGNGAGLGARLVPAALGTDTGGSVRIPASLCGCCALRPTFGRYSGYGIMPISVSRDTVGPMARTIADLALLDGAIIGGPTSIDEIDMKKVRLGIPRAYYYAIVDTAITPIIENSLDILSDLGTTIMEIDIPNLENLTRETRQLIGKIEIGRDIPGYLAESGGGIEMETFISGICNLQTRTLFENNQAVTMKEHQQLTTMRKALRNEFREYFITNKLDAIVFPTTPLAARPISQGSEVTINGTVMSSFAAYNHNTMPGSSIGLPGVAMPAGLTDDGLPVSLGLDGLHGSDRNLLAISGRIEKALNPIPPPQISG